VVQLDASMIDSRVDNRDDLVKEEVPVVDVRKVVMVVQVVDHWFVLLMASVVVDEDENDDDDVIDNTEVLMDNY
jgi:hypothetical protein